MALKQCGGPTLEKCRNMALKQCGSLTLEQCVNMTLKQCSSMTLWQCVNMTLKQYRSQMLRQWRNITLKQSERLTWKQYRIVTLKQCGSLTLEICWNCHVETSNKYNGFSMLFQHAYLTSFQRFFYVFCPLGIRVRFRSVMLLQATRHTFKKHSWLMMHKWKTKKKLGINKCTT